MSKLSILLLVSLALPTSVNSETYLRLGVGTLKKDKTTTEYFSTGASDPPVSQKVIGEINYTDYIFFLMNF